MRNRCGISFLLVSLWTGVALADPLFAVKIEAPPAKKAQKGVAKIHVSPGSGAHLNKEYPTSVTVVAPTGVTVDKTKQTAKDAVKFEEAGAEFDVGFTAADAGKKTFTGELKFAVCTPTSCDPKKEKISFTVDVN
jgi:hypothetical protein